MNPEDLMHRFAFHAATTDGEAHGTAASVTNAYSLPTSSTSSFQKAVRRHSPSLKLEEVMFWGNAALARTGDDA